ncbi:zinc-binding dehydrogenase [Sphingobacterium endophyticum]|uniref:zinc-binding dehydrogenase n=1 Tax=Sphingobacterium endophyticum TaxID=2546448 RepID=UPI0012E1375F|nr:zinc-binding dehydrogenase [Sphingobacterium endophyticum]
MESIGRYFVFNSEQGTLSEEKRSLPEVGDFELLVKIDYCSLCGSDLHTYCGIRKEANPTILGHEIVGTVIELDKKNEILDLSGSPIHINDRITWTVFASNPKTEGYNPETPQKNSGLYKYGHRQLTEDDNFHGGLASHILLKKDTGIRILPKELPLPIAATINCAIATSAGAIRLCSSINAKVIFISGMGMLGLTAVAMCKEFGAEKIIVSDTDYSRLELAKEFGADLAFNSKDNIVSSLLNLPIDRFIDMSGSPEAMETGLQILGVNGVAVFVGAVFKQRAIEIDAEQVIRKLLQIKGLHNYNYDDFNTATDFIIENYNKYPFAHLIEKEFDFDQIEEAFEFAVKNKPVRTGIKID